MSPRATLVLGAYGLPALALWVFLVASVAHELAKPDEAMAAQAADLPRPLVAMLHALAVAFVALMVVPLCLVWPWTLLSPKAHLDRALCLLGGGQR